MQKIKRIVGFMCVMMLSVIMTFEGLAMPFDPNDYTTVEVKTDLLPPSVRQSMVSETSKDRGIFFMKADLIIKDSGDGGVGAFAKAFMSVPVDEVYITIYLDQWDENTGRWNQINYYDAEFYAADFPEGLSDPSLDITFVNQKRGEYYRLRGVYAASLNGKLEGFSSATNGVKLE